MRLGTASWQNPYARHLCCQLRACRYRPRNCRPPISMKNSRRALPLANSHKASLTAQTSTQAERLMRSGAHRSTPGSCRLGVVCDDRARFASLFTSASPRKRPTRCTAAEERKVPNADIRPRRGQVQFCAARDSDRTLRPSAAVRRKVRTLVFGGTALIEVSA